MKSLPGSVHQNVEKTAGNTTPDSRVFDILQQFPQLEQLSQYLRSGGPNTALTIGKTLRVRELAMLEAELRNQSLLTPTLPGVAGCFAHRASLDASTWRWRARRMRVKSVPVLIDVPRYLLTWSEELIASLSAYNIVLNNPAPRGGEQPVAADRRDIIAKLTYLNQFAAYLLGVELRAELPFGRGFRALLRVIASGEETSLESHESAVVEVLVLPTTKHEFNQVLRSYLDREPNSGR